jgi:hypothetical protein
MSALHILLERQLKRLGITEYTPPDANAWANLLQRLNQTYADADKERYLLEHSLEVSSREMENEIAERRNAEAALQEAQRSLEIHARHLERVNELFRATLEQVMMTAKRGTSSGELLNQLSIIQREFERLDKLG